MIDYETRFWSQVDKQGACWRWLGTTSAKGYGIFYARVGRHKFWKAHCFSWYLRNGISIGGMWVLHSCDNPWCVNPEHLWLGTNRDNMDDKIAKDRHNRGETHHGAKLNDELVMQIRSWGIADSTWADRLGVHETTIWCARVGKKWKHLPMPAPAQQRQTQE